MPSEEALFPKYPAFQPMFERADDVPVPLHLTLLNLGAGCEVSLAQVRRILEISADLTPQIVALLDDANWRPQLVGAVAMHFGAANEKSRDALWRAFDSGSWVSPQLAAIAFLVDEDFEAQARRRMEAGCAVNRDRLEGLDWIARHSAAGPISFSAHSSKALSALIALSQRLPDAPWLDQLLAREDIQQSIQSDRDGGGRIAVVWLERFTQVREQL